MPIVPMGDYDTLGESIASFELLRREFEHMSNPSVESRLCYYTMSGAVPPVLTREPHIFAVGPLPLSIEQVNDHFERQHKIIVLSLRWATYSRSDKEMENIENQTCKDKPGQEPTLQHHTTRYGISKECGELQSWTIKLGHMFISRCFAIFQQFQDDLENTQAQIHGIRYDLLPNHRRWPRCLEDLFPNGPQATIQGIVAWLTRPTIDMYLRVKLLTAINQLLDVAHSVLTPYAVRSAGLWRGIVKSMETAFETLTQEKAILTTKTDADHPLWALYHAAQILSMLERHSSLPALEGFIKFGDHTLLGMCARGHEAALRQMNGDMQTRIRATTGYSTSTECNHIMRLLAHFASKILKMSPHLSQLPMESPVTKATFMRLHTLTEMRSNHHNDFLYLAEFMRELAVNQMCRRIGCRRTTADIGRGLLICRGCHRFRYCSRKCQKWAWNREVSFLNHRNVCGTIGVVCSRQSMPSGRELVARTRTAYISEWFKSEPDIPMFASPWLLRYLVQRMVAYSVADGDSYNAEQVET